MALERDRKHQGFWSQCASSDTTEWARRSAWVLLGTLGGGEVHGRSFNSEACFQQAIEEDPEDAWAWYFLGYRGGGEVNGQPYSRIQCFLKVNRARASTHGDGIRGFCEEHGCPNPFKNMISDPFTRCPLSISGQTSARVARFSNPAQIVQAFRHQMQRD